MKYTDGGLNNVTLVGVEFHKCPHCGEEYHGYRKMDQLHKVIADALIRKPSVLSGSEFRFLRKYLGFARDVFAKRIGRAPETISRYEVERQPIPVDLDLLMRSLVANKYPDRNYDFHEIFMREPTSPKASSSMIRVKQTQDSWRLTV